MLSLENWRKIPDEPLPYTAIALDREIRTYYTNEIDAYVRRVQSKLRIYPVKKRQILQIEDPGQHIAIADSNKAVLFAEPRRAQDNLVNLLTTYYGLTPDSPLEETIKKGSERTLISRLYQSSVHVLGFEREHEVWNNAEEIAQITWNLVDRSPEKWWDRVELFRAR